MTDKPRREPNRLSWETSPYLQQHAYNPVDWYPWGPEALERAAAEDKPIFLSIGYSACHWCHVMEHESFEDAGIAAYMNEHFVNIKVDREERPDLDQIYMNAVVAMTQRGGWPMSVFLTPEQQPFYGGTYWPPRSRMGMPGFTDVLRGVLDAWDKRRDEVQQAALDLTDAVTRMGLPRLAPAPWSEATLQQAERTLLRAADIHHGGFGGAPKFPHTMDLKLLLRTYERFGNEDALKIARLTLDKMAAGGIYDHLGGGFHRYSVDDRWLVPHFEKMLYDNALLAGTYLEAWQLTGDENYRRVVRETLDYVLREMTQPQGGFYSTQDADSEGEEGKFFVWSQAEVREQLGDAAELFGYVYDVTPHGNWEHSNIFNRVHTDAEAAAKFSLSLDQVWTSLAASRSRLFEVRRKRVAPGRDDKILTSWNGLMIAAMARAGAALEAPEYIQAATAAVNFILKNLRTESGTLLHVWKDGQARFTGCLDDYACLLDGLAELYQSTFAPRHLEAAAELAETMVRLFHDPDQGGFFYTGRDHENLIARQKDLQDNATPSGNSMAATALLKLSRLCGRSDWAELAEGTLKVMSGQFERMSTAHGQAFVALDFLLGPAHEYVFIPGGNATENQRLLARLQTAFLPNKVLIVPPAGEPPELLAPVLQGKTAVQNQPTLYICETGLCQSPLVGSDAILGHLAE